MINKKKFDYILALLLVLLLLYGFIAIYTASASKVSDQFIVKNYWWKQIIFSVILFVAIYFLFKLPLPIFEALVFPLYLLNLIALFLVLFTPAINGSHRWFSLFGINYQPSESAKLLTILFTARLLSKEHLGEFQMLLYGIVCVLPPVVLIILEPDIGTTLVYLVSLFSMYAAAGLPTFYLLLIVSPLISIIVSFNWALMVIWLVVFVLILIRFKLSWVVVTISSVINVFLALIMPFFWNSLKQYQQNRILTFLDPSRDPLGAGYQIIQAKIAVGSGGTLGKGFLEGTQKNMNFVPEHHTDFIFSIIGEEFGFVGSLILLSLFFLFFWRISKAIKDIRIKERKIVISGIFGYLAFQTFINIGMNIGLAPTTGIPLPFISYGGSNLLINGVAIGLILKYLNERGFMK